ncbi:MULTISPECIES: MoaD/ThiS family protein [unclassified Curtobacterium]|uniref:MoaD/ThiS family protein n=1 Tax=unclassified Curtobacterium TaxID=257496 RepID=UPI000DA875C1|nr:MULTISPECIES: MoaD/ThiS family protein [unclassified Curtobacterium]WIE83453.1 MoaD/ThiS family protein [Curtobacterium sp. MCPF17_021]
MTTLIVSPAWKTDDTTEFRVPAESIESILLNFAERFPANRRRVVGEDGRVYGYFSVFLDGERVPLSQWHDTVVGDSSTVEVLPPLVGG